MAGCRLGPWLPLVTLWILSGCGEHRGPGGAVPPGTPGSIPGPTSTDLASALPGIWQSGCTKGPGDTSRRTMYRFGIGDSKVEIQSTTFQGGGCQPPELLKYRFSGTYKPAPYTGEVTEAYLTVLRDDLAAEANRTPPLYDYTDWKIGNETPLRGKLSPENFRALTEAIFPKQNGALLEGGNLYLAQDVTTKADPFTKVRAAMR